MSEQDGYLKIKDYVEALRRLGGEASTREIADEVGRTKATVRRMFDRQESESLLEEKREVEIYERHPVRKKKLAGGYVYEISESQEDDND